MPLLDILDRDLLGATVTRWLIAGGVLVGGYAILVALRRWLAYRLTKLARRTATPWDDLIAEIVRRTRHYFLIAVAAWIASRFLPLAPDIASYLRGALVLVGLVQSGVWGNGIIGFAAERYIERRGGAGDLATRATIHAVGYIGRLVLWILLVVTALESFDIRVTALLTGLGIGGIAVALALQNVLGDLFAALAIVLDKPFVIGDFVIFDDVKGRVEHLGLKTTRIRSLGGEQIIIANSDLLKARIRNYGRMEERRVVFTLDVTYDTPPDAVAGIPDIVRSVIESHSKTRFDRCHFLTFADSSLRVETVYHVLDPDYNKYADIQHAINLELLRRFNADGIEFAFPSRTVVLKHDASGTHLQPANRP